MTQFIFFLIGLLLGGIIGVTMMCLVQINQLNHITTNTKEVDTNEKKNC